ncbi:hypothetical protein CEAn_00638 [Coxiella endosymbiont of Amblyomma nuttalli]|nr:hypothetical protein CEAn_00638 [Coxiella endosymbiont of Amblyomma nuttalli]
MIEVSASSSITLILMPIVYFSGNKKISSRIIVDIAAVRKMDLKKME